MPRRLPLQARTGRPAWCSLGVGALGWLVAGCTALFPFEPGETDAGSGKNSDAAAPSECGEPWDVEPLGVSTLSRARSIALDSTGRIFVAVQDLPVTSRVESFEPCREKPLTFPIEPPDCTPNVRAVAADDAVFVAGQAVCDEGLRWLWAELPSEGGEPAVETLALGGSPLGSAYAAVAHQTTAFLVGDYGTPSRVGVLKISQRDQEIEILNEAQAPVSGHAFATAVFGPTVFVAMDSDGDTLLAQITQDCEGSGCTAYPVTLSEDLTAVRILTLVATQDADAVTVLYAAGTAAAGEDPAGFVAEIRYAADRPSVERFWLLNHSSTPGADLDGLSGLAFNRRSNRLVAVGVSGGALGSDAGQHLGQGVLVAFQLGPVEPLAPVACVLEDRVQVLWDVAVDEVRSVIYASGDTATGGVVLRYLTVETDCSEL